MPALKDNDDLGQVENMGKTSVPVAMVQWALEVANAYGEEEGPRTDHAPLVQLSMVAKRREVSQPVRQDIGSISSRLQIAAPSEQMMESVCASSGVFE